MYLHPHLLCQSWESWLGEKLPYWKNGGACQKFLKECLRDTKILFWGGTVHVPILKQSIFFVTEHPERLPKLLIKPLKAINDEPFCMEVSPIEILMVHQEYIPLVNVLLLFWVVCGDCCDQRFFFIKGQIGCWDKEEFSKMLNFYNT